MIILYIFLFYYYLTAIKDDGADFRSLLKHKEFAKRKQDGENGEKVDLKHGLLLFNNLTWSTCNTLMSTTRIIVIR